MSKAKGLHTFTVQEAQNATMGQASTVFVDDTGAFTPRANSGLVIVAIQVIDDATFSLLTPEDTANHVGADNTNEKTTHNNGESLASVSIPAGTTFYGRWTAATMSAGSCFYYLG
mgnify:CR=1 FL=1